MLFIFAHHFLYLIEGYINASVTTAIKISQDLCQNSVYHGLKTTKLIKNYASFIPAASCHSTTIPIS